MTYKELTPPPPQKNLGVLLVSVPAIVLMKRRARHKPVPNKLLPNLLADISSLRECESIDRLHCGDMSAYILQHSVRRTVNISPLHNNSGSLLGPSVLAAQTGQGAGTELWYMHELYWGSLSSAEFQSKAVIFP